MAKKILKPNKEEAEQAPVYGDPSYSEKSDIYSQEEKLELIDSEQGDSDKKEHLKKHQLGEDLDVPGSELDDSDEQIGEEDEENNYYSLGGDDHNDLEEDRGE